MIIRKDLMFKRFGADELSFIEILYKTIRDEFLKEEYKYRKSGIMYKNNFLRITFYVRETEKSIILTKCN